MNRGFIRRLLIPMLMYMTIGCASPNVQPFADATVDLRRAVVESGSVTASSMAVAAEVNKKSWAMKDASRFADVWKDRIMLMDVLVAYSDSVANIALAGKDSKQTAQALGDSVKDLAELVPSSGSAVDQGIDLGQRLIAIGIEIKTFYDLKSAVGAAHETLERIAEFLQNDLADLKRLYIVSSQEMERALDDEFGQRESDRMVFLSKRDNLRMNLVNDFNDLNVERLKKVEDLVAYMEPEHHGYMQRREELLKKRVATIQLFDKAERGVKAWSQSHKELKAALEQNRRPNVRLIISTAQEIKDAVDRVQNM